MPYFEVSPSNLLAASATLNVSSGDQGTKALAGTAGAAQATPAAGAWQGLVDRADQASQRSTAAVSDLGRALEMAANAYWITERDNAASYGAGG